MGKTNKETSGNIKNDLDALFSKKAKKTIAKDKKPEAEIKETAPTTKVVSKIKKDKKVQKPKVADKKDV